MFAVFELGYRFPLTLADRVPLDVETEGNMRQHQGQQSPVLRMSCSSAGIQKPDHMGSSCFDRVRIPSFERRQHHQNWAGKER